MAELTPRARARRHGAGPRRPKVTLDQLHTFIAVAEREHVTAAAVALRLSQGSVSAAIHRLEETLGVPLFNRVGRHVRLTDVGRAVRQFAIRTLDAAAEIEQLAAGYLAFERGAVEIASGRVLGAHRLSGWLAPFVMSHPDVEVRIHLTSVPTLTAMLQEGAVDVAILGADVRIAGVETVTLERTDLVIVVAAQHELARSAAPLRALGDHRYLVHESGSATQMRAARVLGSHADTSATVELEEGALLAALLAGIGFAVMPRSVVQSDIASGRLVVLERRAAPVIQQFTAARRQALHTPAVQAFWDHLLTLAWHEPAAGGLRARPTP
jgi:DNA-binding transcriptional LysR family regulator